MPKKIKEIVNQHFFKPAWYSVVINPYFIARRGLLNKIKKFANNDFSGKNILDVGCGIKPYEKFFNSASYLRIERLFVKNKPLKLLFAVFLCFPIQVFFIFLDFIFKNSWLTLDYVIIAKK